MPISTAVLIVWVSVVTAQSPEAKPGTSEVDTLRRLSDEFETAQKAAFEQARKVKPSPDRTSSTRVVFDARPYARRFLDLARESRDEEVTVDALVWVVRHAGRTPEHAEAIGRMEQRFLRSDRIAGACWPIATTGESGERILGRIVGMNPNAKIRGQACLGLTFARRMLLRQVRRFKTTGAERRYEWIKAYGQEQVDRLEQLDPAVLVSESEQWLDRMLRFFPAAVLNPEVSDFFPILSEDLGPASEKILRRAAQEHPDPTTRQEASCALLLQQMGLARIVARAANEKARGRPSRGLEDVPGGADRIASVDPHVLAAEIDRRLLDLAEKLDNRPSPETRGLARQGINLSHLLTDLGSNQAYYAGAEQLLRKGFESHPDEQLRSHFRRALALHLAGLAQTAPRLRLAAGADLAYWEALFGPDRVKQLQGLDVSPLQQEARALTERIAGE